MPAADIAVKLKSRERSRTASLGRKPAAERMADQMKPLEPQFLDEIEIEHREVADIADPRRIVRRAEARMLRHQHLEPVGDRIEERQPLRQAVGAVQEQHRRPFADAVQLDCDVPDADVCCPMSRHFLAPCLIRHLSRMAGEGQGFGAGAGFAHASHLRSNDNAAHAPRFT